MSCMMLVNWKRLLLNVISIVDSNSENDSERLTILETLQDSCVYWGGEGEID